jgi:hypothetical protein
MIKVDQRLKSAGKINGWEIYPDMQRQRMGKNGVPIAAACAEQNNGYSDEVQS